MKEKHATTRTALRAGGAEPWKRIVAALLTFALVFQQMPVASIAQAADEPVETVADTVTPAKPAEGGTPAEDGTPAEGGTPAEDGIEPAPADGITAVDAKSEDGVLEVADEQAADGAKSLVSNDVAGVTVKATFEPQTFATDATLKVKEITNKERIAEAKEFLAQATEAQSGEAAAFTRVFDISFLNSAGEEMQPADGKSVNISFAFADEQIDDGMEIVVAHLPEDGKNEVVESVAVNSAANEVSFEADSFSDYVISGNAGFYSFVYTWQAAKDCDTVKLDKDIIADGASNGNAKIKDSKHITLDLNGHTINGQGGGRQYGTLATVSGGATLTIIDSSTEKTGKITGFNKSAIRMEDNSTLNLEEDVTITGNQSDKGGAIYAWGNGITININGAKITDNAATGPGGGIYLQGNSNWNNPTYGVPKIYSTVNFNSGEISNNVAQGWGDLDGGGGVMLYGDSRFIMNGGKVQGNQAVGRGGGGIKAGFYNNYTDPSDVYVEIKGGDIIDNKSHGEGAGISIGGGCQGVIVADEGKTINIKNNAVDSNTEDWGGGGIFVAASSQGVTFEASGAKYGDPGNLLVQKAVISENSAEGFGGGVAGCSTGRIFANAVDDNTVTDAVKKDAVTTSGVAIFNNKANGDTNHLSGGSSSKHEDHEYTAGNDTFWQEGYADYFCALNSQVGDDMLGGGQEMWKGSSDGDEVTWKEGETDHTVLASYLCGLTAQASDTDKENANNSAQVFIQNNSSGTHGGGILVNGVAVLGAEPRHLEVQDRVMFTASKTLFSADGQWLNQPQSGFTFDVYGWDGVPVSELKTVTEDDARYGQMYLTLAYNGGTETNPYPYTYFVAESRDKNKNNQDTYELDNTVYYIEVGDGKAQTRVTETAGDLFGNLDTAIINRIRIVKRVEPDNAFTDEGNLVHHLAGSNDFDRDARWQYWQKGTGIYSTYYNKNLDINVDDDNITVVLDYDLAKDTAIVNDQVVARSEVDKYINLSTGTDHAKTIDLERFAVETGLISTFVNRIDKSIDVSVAKKWVDGGKTNHDQVTLQLYQNGSPDIVMNPEAGSETQQKTITLNGQIDEKGEDRAWVATFKNLPYSDRSDPEHPRVYTYTVKEVSTSSGYTVSYPSKSSDSADDNDCAKPGETITNTIKQETVSVSVTKEWSGTGVQTYPDVTFVLKRDGSEFERYTVNGGSTAPTGHTFNGLDKYAVGNGGDGHEYVYTVEEVPINGWKSSMTKDSTGNYNFTNTPDDSTVVVSGTKTWVAPAGMDLPYVTFQLECQVGESGDYVAVEGKTVTGKGLKRYTFADLPKYAYDDQGQGTECHYRVREVLVQRYVVDSETQERVAVPDDRWDNAAYVDGNNTTAITNTIKQEKVSVSGTKTWVVPVGMQLPSVTIQLQRKHGNNVAEDVTGKTYTIPAGTATEATYEFDNLDKYYFAGNTCEEYIYSVREIFADGETDKWTSAYDGMNVTNTLKDYKTTSVSGTKTWLGPIGVARPDITINLYRSDKPEEVYRSTVIKDGMDGYQFTDLPSQYVENGERKDYEYRVEEVDSDGWNSTQNGNDFTNTIKQLKMTISGQKSWVTRSTTDEATITLHRNGRKNGLEIDETVDIVKLRPSETSYEFKNLDVYYINENDPNNCYRYTYWVEEEASDKYEQTQSGYNFRNISTEKTSVVVTKVWQDSEASHPDVTFTLLRKDPVVGTDGKVVTDEEGNARYAYVTVQGVAPITIHNGTTTAKFENLPVFDPTDGHRYEYLVEESDLPGYYRRVDSSSILPTGHGVDARIAFTNIKYSRSLEGTVWYDGTKDAADGERKDGEPLYEGVTVTLYKTDGTKVAETTTNKYGHYKFEGLEPGEYEVFVGKDMETTAKDARGVSLDVNSNANREQGGARIYESEVDLHNGEGRHRVNRIYPPTDDELFANTTYQANDKGNYNIPDLDAGFVNSYTRSLEGTLWYDGKKDEADGMRSEGEMMYAGQLVELYKIDKEAGTAQRVALTTTDENGHYKFTGLEPGYYKVVVPKDMDVTAQHKDGVAYDVNSNGVCEGDRAVILESEIDGKIVNEIHLPADQEIAAGQYKVDEKGNYNIPHLDIAFVDAGSDTTPSETPASDTPTGPSADDDSETTPSKTPASSTSTTPSTSSTSTTPSTSSTSVTSAVKRSTLATTGDSLSAGPTIAMLAVVGAATVAYGMRGRRRKS